MKAFLILEDGTVFTGTSIGSTKDVISEIVFNTSMTGVSGGADRSFLCRTGRGNDISIDRQLRYTSDMESKKAWPDGYIVRELSRIPSNFPLGRHDSGFPEGAGYSGYCRN